MMRLALVLLFSITAVSLNAQSFRGRIIDVSTKQPIAGATVRSQSSTVTDVSGMFSLSNVKPGDTVKVVHINYKPYVFTFNRLHPGTAPGPPPEFGLLADSIELREVAVKATRNYKADSLKNRIEFASAFAHKTAGLKDIFMLKSPEEAMARYVDVHRGNNSYSASSVVKIDVLKALGFFSKNKTAPSRLQQALLRDEGDKYIDQVFSEQHVTRITSLKGDSLRMFMLLYRPSLMTAGKMSVYDMMGYIRAKYAAFIKNGFKTPLSDKPKSEKL